MSASASSSKGSRKSCTTQTWRARATTTFALAVVFLVGMIWDQVESNHAAWIAVIVHPDSSAGVTVLSVSTATALAKTRDEPAHVDEKYGQFDRENTCDSAGIASLARLELPTAEDDLDHEFAPAARTDIFDSLHVAFAGQPDLFGYAQRQLLPEFASAYRPVFKLAALMQLPRIRYEAEVTRTMIFGTVSTYNPYRDGKEEGGAETASGELYDPDGWTAAIQTDLRNQFGGVRYGKLYQPTFALVATAEKQVIVKINDVGRLRPGRVLDLNERTMRYFDPFLTRGLIDDVRITLLPVEDWTAGPVNEDALVSLASVQ